MESISFQTACAREPSLKFIYIHTERLPELESWTSSSRQYFCALRTLDCFVPIGWASLFTLILSMRQGSIRGRSHSLPPQDQGGVDSLPVYSGQRSSFGDLARLCL